MKSGRGIRLPGLPRADPPTRDIHRRRLRSRERRAAVERRGRAGRAVRRALARLRLRDAARAEGAHLRRGQGDGREQHPAGHRAARRVQALRPLGLPRLERRRRRGRAVAQVRAPRSPRCSSACPTTCPRAGTAARSARPRASPRTGTTSASWPSARAARSARSRSSTSPTRSRPSAALRRSTRACCPPPTTRSRRASPGSRVLRRRRVRHRRAGLARTGVRHARGRRGVEVRRGQRPHARQRGQPAADGPVLEGLLRRLPPGGRAALDHRARLPGRPGVPERPGLSRRRGRAGRLSPRLAPDAGALRRRAHLREHPRHLAGRVRHRQPLLQRGRGQGLARRPLLGAPQAGGRRGALAGDQWPRVPHTVPEEARLTAARNKSAVVCFQATGERDKLAKSMGSKRRSIAKLRKATRRASKAHKRRKAASYRARTRRALRDLSKLKRQLRVGGRARGLAVRLGARLPGPDRHRHLSVHQAASSTGSPIGSQRKRARTSSGAPASSRSIASRPWRKCFQPS